MEFQATMDFGLMPSDSPLSLPSLKLASAVTFQLGFRILVQDASAVLFTFSFTATYTMISRIGQSVMRQVRTQIRPRTSPTPIASLSALARLLSSLAVLEQKDGKLNHASLGAVTAAQKLGGSITAFVAGGSIKAVAEEAAKVGGIEKIISVDNAAYDKVLLLKHYYSVSAI